MVDVERYPNGGARLFTMIKVNRKTGAKTVLYGHATSNVIADYWAAYVDSNYDVIVREWKEGDNLRNL